MKKYRTAPVPSEKMPTGLPYIISNEAAERFSFYGMKGILLVYMANYLHLMGDQVGTQMSGAQATANYHWFNSAVYWTPLFGALLADAFLGKYRTIMILSIVYCAGHGALAFMGLVGDPRDWLFMGLVLIAIGAGGIKPCVSAHVGDQFGKTNSHLISKAFNFFYFSINLGAFISSALTPWLLKWYGPHVAFGIPGILMAIATVAFWLGRNTFVHVPARGWAYFKDLFSGMGLKTVGKLCIIYLFVAVFWALFDQTSSSWILQAETMDRNWMGIHWLPSQVHSVNAVCILLFIPLTTYFVYPAINKVFKLTPLRKVSIGLFIMVVGFGLVAFVQEWIDDGAIVSVGWQIGAIAIVTLAEVMVSIVVLEFSYTQAPNSMKSIIMAFYLCSVSVGNIFTALVNSHIQVDDPTSNYALLESIEGDIKKGNAKIRLEENIAVFAGANGEFEDKEAIASDDIRILYGSSGERRATNYPGRFELERAARLIEKAAAPDGDKENIKLLSDEEGQKLLAKEQDPWGSPIRYELLNFKKFRVSSPGPDKEFLTKWDVGIVVSITKEKEERPWLAKHMEKKGFTNKAKQEDLDESFKSTHPVEGGLFSRSAYTGGQVTLEGASYFWFFTRLMLGTAALFVVVVLFYKPKTYLQDEEPPSPEEKAEEDLGARGVMS